MTTEAFNRANEIKGEKIKVEDVRRHLGFIESDRTTFSIKRYANGEDLSIHGEMKTVLLVAMKVAIEEYEKLLDKEFEEL